MKIGRNVAKKIKVEIPHLNNSKSFWKNYAYAFQSTNNYLFCWHIFQQNWINVYKNNDKNIQLVGHIQTVWETGFDPDRHRLVW